MYAENLKAQYELMDDSNLNEHDQYVPSFEVLIEEAPNEEMRNKWIECEARLKLWEKENPLFSGFAFNSVYMVQKSCGHYEIFQHPSRSEEELVDWIERVELNDNHKCTRCICG